MVLLNDWRNGETRNEDLWYVSSLHTVYMHVQCHANVLYTVGSVSNGEFNSMRAKGYTRPLSILAVRSQVRNKYARMSWRLCSHPGSPLECKFYPILF